MKKPFTAVALFLFLFSMSAFGLTLELNSPSIWSLDIDKKKQEKLIGIHNYMSNELEFIDGMDFASSGFIQQGFSGTSAQTSHFIAMLVESGIWKVSVSFYNYGEQKTVFRTGQNSAKSINIIVNSGRDDFLLKDFAKYLPKQAFDVKDKAKAEEDKKSHPAITPLWEFYHIELPKSE